MTLQQFLDKLAETPRRWKLVDQLTSLRIRSRGRYPLGVVFHRDFGYARAARHAGMLDATVLRIMDAADNHNMPGDATLRARLLKACGLEDER